MRTSTLLLIVAIWCLTALFTGWLAFTLTLSKLISVPQEEHRPHFVDAPAFPSLCRSFRDWQRIMVKHGEDPRLENDALDRYCKMAGE